MGRGGAATHAPRTQRGFKTTRVPHRRRPARTHQPVRRARWRRRRHCVHNAARQEPAISPHRNNTRHRSLAPLGAIPAGQDKVADHAARSNTLAGQSAASTEGALVQPTRAPFACLRTTAIANDNRFGTPESQQHVTAAEHGGSNLPGQRGLGPAAPFTRNRTRS